MKRNISLSLETNIYQEVKRTIPNGQVSPLVNNLLKDYLKKQKEQELKAAYQDFAKNKKLKEELAVWDEAVGKEIGKIRPSLVISNNAQNEYDDQIIVVPLTSEPEEMVKERPFTVLIARNKTNGLEKDSKILLNRVQTIDIKLRLRNYIGYTSPEIAKQAQTALKVVFNID
ncbi:21009_t:CDS:2 [Entrophospora sp. SA101]|nr:1410_t:CDS:2 [Entrophospora sp. SA101]CAJ0746976.1 21009_t:CDS:2 [Entrophospora sp. SA101]CAJ0842013.1 10713_t:CDS:2 [Entrophospora sp. SA101]CAJ0866215.1 13978_t:CDS:2 [Entrophospora sp. SA101]